MNSSVDMSSSEIFEWTRCITTKFIQLLKEFPCLWRVTSRDDKNRSLRIVASRNLAETLNIKSEEIRKKINTAIEVRFFD